MLSSFSQNAILAKIKAMYGKRITPAQYNDMLHKLSIPELASYLKNNTHYRDVMESVNTATIHRGQLETIIKKDLYQSILRLGRYLPGQREQYMQFFVGQLEIEQLVMCVGQFDLEGETELVSDIPGFLIPLLSFDVMALATVETPRQLLSLLEGGPYYKTVEPFVQSENKEFDVAGCTRALRQQYYDNLFAGIDSEYKGRTRQEMRDIISTNVELFNITNIYRLKVFFHYEPEKIRPLLIKNPGSRISERFMEALIQAPDGDRFTQLISQSKYKNYFDQNDFLYIEYHTSYIKYNLNRRHISFATKAPTAFLAFLILGGIEGENLTHIIEGIRYGVAPEDIQKLLII